MRVALFNLGAVTLAILWIGPVPTWAEAYFSAHMTMHMGVVAVAAPLIVFGIAGGPLDPVRSNPLLFAPIPASILELVVVWGWHTPKLHEIARHTTLGLIVEQAMFCAAGLILWFAAFGQDRRRQAGRTAAGVIALLFTSMHMTLLGALLALSQRPLYNHRIGPLEDQAAFDALCRFPVNTRDFLLSPLQDQHLGGAIMLLVGGVSYLAGGLWLTTRILRDDWFQTEMQT